MGKLYEKTIPLSKTTKFVVDNRGRTAPTSSSGIALIATNCISNDDLYPAYKNVRYISGETYREWFRSHPEPGDIILTLKGSQNGAVCLVPDKVDFAIAQDMVALRPDEQKIDPLFLFAALRSRAVQQQIRNLDVSGVIPHLKKGDFDKLFLPYPERHVQEFIGHIHFSLCKKIELNRRMNETLEAMARAIFKDWFVDFGPTRAKMEGRAPYLAPEIWSLFPNHLDDEGKPEGWTTSTIGQEVEVIGGSTPSTKDAAFWGGDISWATPKDLSSLSTPVLLRTERQITEAGLAQIGSGLLPAGSVLLSSRAPIGYMAIAQMPVAVNQGFIAMLCKKRLSNVFVWLWTQANMETVHQNANGSTFQEISKANFRPIEVTVATPELLRAFDETARLLFDRIVANEKENSTLAATRDFLLPRLMSGEVRVGDAASFI